MSRLVVVLVLALALGAVACGSDDEDSGSDQEQLQALYRDFLNAMRSGDAEAACELMTEKTRAATAADFGSCEQALATIAGFEDAGDLDEVRLTKIEVSGDTASAQVQHRHGTEPVRFEKSDGEWRLATQG
jgi:ketosteroid isomerase-like protein